MAVWPLRHAQWIGLGPWVPKQAKLTGAPRSTR